MKETPGEGLYDRSLIITQDLHRPINGAYCLKFAHQSACMNPG